MSQDEADSKSHGAQAPAVDVDEFLVLWVNSVNRSADMSIGFTVAVEGTVVTGQLIGGGEYYRLFADQMRSARGEGAEEWASILAPEIEQVADKYVPDADDSRPVGFMHMKDAHIKTAEGWFPELDHDGLLWRSPLSAMSGWSMGAVRLSD